MWRARSAPTARSARRASSTPWPTGSITGCGVAAPSGSAAGSSSAGEPAAWPPWAETRGFSQARSGLGSAGVLFVARVAQTLLELVLRLSQGAGQLRQLGATEEHEDHDQDDEELASAEACHAGPGTSLDHAADTRVPLPGTASGWGARGRASCRERGGP